MTVTQRFLRYVQIDTESDPANEEFTPSTKKQFDLAQILKKELEDLGAADVLLDEHCYLYASVPAAPGYENAPCLAFISHMDTAPDFTGKNVRPQLIENYDGRDVTLGSSGRILSVSDFPHLAGLAGRTLITSDGTTLLGADDKAGVAEIMTLADRLLHGDTPHGRVSICFTPDEEIGNGVKCIDLTRLNADFGYTLDGGPEGEVVYENFNAASAEIDIRGRSIHPGDAKGLMVNAALVAAELNAMLPSSQVPSLTEGYEGFYHMTQIKGDVDSAHMQYIIRDHDAGCFEAKKKTMIQIVKVLNEKYGEDTVRLSVRDQYKNMVEQIKPCMHLVERARDATRAAGLEPGELPIRGGTDGATLSYMGLPCPNLGTGGYAFHGPYEHITSEGMELCVRIALNLVERYATDPV